VLQMSDNFLFLGMCRRFCSKREGFCSILA
jgi:hypothetical protein